MHLSILLDMSADALADRPAFTDSSGTITYGELRDQARALAHRLQVGGQTTLVGGQIVGKRRGGRTQAPCGVSRCD